MAITADKIKAKAKEALLEMARAWEKEAEQAKLEARVKELEAKETAK